MIYFDNASTTEVSENVYKGVCDFIKNDFGNPSSLHRLGFETEKKINGAREEIARVLGVSPEEIYFTSGGTEANNTAIIGTALRYKRYGSRVITMRTQHPSAEEAFRVLAGEGFEVIYIDVDSKGYVDRGQLLESITEDTVLVSIMHVNNEVGTIQDIEGISAEVKKKNPKAVFHTDHVQGFGKHMLNTKNIDLISVSGHKIHALKGVGVLSIKKGIRIKSLIYGGSQQGEIRPGTENTSGIISMGIACRDCYERLEENIEKVGRIKKKMLEAVQRIENVTVNGDSENGTPYILSLSFAGLRGEVLLHALENEDIFVSTGSACSSRNRKKKTVVDYLDSSKTEGTVRFSFSEKNTVEEAEKCLEALERNVRQLRMYKRR